MIENKKTPQDVLDQGEIEKIKELISFRSQKIEIVTNGSLTTVMFDGQEITNVTGIRYEHTTKGLPKLTVSIFATDVTIKQPVAEIIINSSQLSK